MFRFFPPCDPLLTCMRIFAPVQSLLLGDKAELTGKNQLEGVSSFGRLAQHAEPSFHKRVHRRFEGEERFKQVCEFHVTKVASSDERQGINSGPDENRTETSFPQQNTKTVGRVVPITARMERFEMRGRADENTIRLHYSVDFGD